MKPIRVLFLCTGNSARSQMAEAFLRKYGGEQFEVCSAGLEPKPVHPFTVRVMQEAGIDISGQRSKGVGEFLGNAYFHYLITVCDAADQNCPTVWPGITQRLHWSFPDPASFDGAEEEKLAFFRQVRDQIDARTRSWLSTR